LFLAVMGLALLQKVWKHALVIVAVAGVVIWWVIYFNVL
jgi:hypothetical protein